jgi:plastocyanin
MYSRWGKLLATVAAIAVVLAMYPGARSTAFGADLTGPVGSVEGTINLVVVGEAAPPMLSPYARRRYRPPTPTQEAPGSPRNVIVYVLVDGPVPATARPSASVLQQDQTIIPHVTAVQKGTRIEFPNQDSVFHNLFSLGGAQPFNLGRYAPGTSRAATFEKAGVVRMFCDIHSNMGGIILVLDTPYFTRPDENGRFRIEGLPVGRHTLVAWHESTGTISREIVVTAGGVTRAEINLPG